MRLAFGGWEDAGKQQEGKSWGDVTFEEVTSVGCWQSLSGKLALGAGRAGASLHFYRQAKKDKDTPLRKNITMLGFWLLQQELLKIPCSGVLLLSRVGK